MCVFFSESERISVYNILFFLYPISRHLHGLAAALHYKLVYGKTILSEYVCILLIKYTYKPIYLYRYVFMLHNWIWRIKLIISPMLENTYFSFYKNLILELDKEMYVIRETTRSVQSRSSRQWSTRKLLPVVSHIQEIHLWVFEGTMRWTDTQSREMTLAQTNNLSQCYSALAIKKMIIWEQIKITMFNSILLHESECQWKSKSTTANNQTTRTRGTKNIFYPQKTTTTGAYLFQKKTSK